LLSSLIQRSDYPTLQESVYLNQASLGLIGNPAVDAMHDLLDRVARHGNLHMSDEDEVAFLDGLRERAARLLMVEGFRIAILSSASELLSQAPFLLAPRRGSTVIAVATDFPAITRPWLRLAESGECLVEFVEDRPESDLTADVVAQIDARTSVVCGRMGPVRDGDGDRCSPAPSGHRRSWRQARSRRDPGGRCDDVRCEHMAPRSDGVQRLQVAQWPWRSGDRSASP
jgi:hypothetical protein